MKNYVTLPEAALKSAIAIPWDFAVLKKSLGSLVNSLRFPWFSQERSFPCFQSVWEPWLTLAAAIAFMLVMSMVSQRPRRQYMVLQWGQVDLQEYANGSFVSNNNIFTIPFLNTYYHKQMNNILIAAYNETFRQSSDPVYAHTPMRNVGGLRTFNPKLKDSAGSEVNNLLSLQDIHKYLIGKLMYRVYNNELVIFQSWFQMNNKLSWLWDSSKWTVSYSLF